MNPLSASFFLLALSAVAETILLRNGKKVHGEIVADTFAVQTPSGLVKVKREDVERIEFPPNKAAKEKQKRILSVTEIKKQSVPVRYDDLVRYPEKFDGKLVHFTGMIFNVTKEDEDLTVQIKMTKGNIAWFDDVMVLAPAKFRVVNGDLVEVWGESVGPVTYSAQFGNAVSAPGINGLVLEIKRKAGSSD